MADNLVLELQKVGLDERQAKIYLATLELGPSPVQKIAQRSGIPRATTYLVLDDLQSKGFVTTYDEGKKSFYVAESPERLAMLVEKREADVVLQKDVVNKIVPELISRGQFERGEQPTIRYYEGADAVKAFLRDMLGGRGGEVLSILYFDKAKETLEHAGITVEKVRERRAQHRIKSRVIYTATHGPIRGYSTKARKVKYLPVEEYPFDADINIRDDRVFFTPYSAPMRGVAIEDKAIARTMKMIFEALWASLK